MKRGIVFGVAFFAVVLAAVLFAGRGLLSIAEPPDCVLPSGGGSCEVELRLPQDQAYSVLYADLRFDSVAGSRWSEPVRVVPFATASGRSSTSSSDSEHTVEAYRLPSSWTRIQEVNVTYQYQWSSTCDPGSREVAQVVSQALYYPEAYPSSSVVTCTASDNDRCRGPYLVYDYADDYDVNGVAVQTATVGRCSGSTPTTSGVSKWNAVLPNAAIVNETGVFLLEHRTRQNQYGGTAQARTEWVEMRYTRAEFPSNVAVFVGGRFTQQLPGEQVGVARTLDFASVANTACGRPGSGSDCVVKVRIESTTGGKVWFDESAVYRVNEQTTPEAPPVDTGAPAYGLWARFVRWLRGLWA